MNLAAWPKMESWFKDGQRLEATKALREAGCCIRCVLRYLGERRPSVYGQCYEKIESLLNEFCNGAEFVDAETNGDLKSVSVKTEPDNVDSSIVNSSTDNVCVACLGILQNHCTKEAVKSICESIASHDYQFTSFMCSVSVPVSTLIRKHSLWIYMKEKFLDVYDGHTQCDIPDIKEVWKWTCGPILSELLSIPFEPKSSFSIAMNFSHEKSGSECQILRSLSPEQFVKRKSKNPVANNLFTRVVITKVLSEAIDEDFKCYISTPPCIPTQPAVCEPITCQHDAIYVAGRYNKYSRVLSQTPWFIEGVRKSVTSVEELISQCIIEKFRCKDQKFSSSGREDVDVRMLGRGRPFVLELIDPHRVHFTQTQLTEIQRSINKSTDLIKVRDLQIVTKGDTSILKIGEESKVKVYSSVCWCQRNVTSDDMDKISKLKDIKLQQRTPIRVLHRRNLSTREKTIHSLSGEIIDDHHFKLLLSSQAGTYIKEFVHGDFGRTVPSLGDLLQAECDIISLDVEDVIIDWPKTILDENLAAEDKIEEKIEEKMEVKIEEKKDNIEHEDMPT